VQVQMGLYGGVKKDAAAGVAYAGNPLIDASFENEAILFYSEIDPALHAAVNNGTYGTPAYPSALHYDPRYFLVNGETFSGNRLIPRAEPILDHAILSTERVLIRIFNAGLKTHIPAIMGANLNVIAEDGNLSPYQKSQYEVHLGALQTMDAILVDPPIGTYPIYDRAMHLTDKMSSPGGMLVYLMSGAPVVANDLYATDKDLPLDIAAPGVLNNDTSALPMQAVLVGNVQHGTLELNPDGSFLYIPALLYDGPDSFTYKASNGALSELATVSITVNYVNHPPTARADSGTTRRSRAVTLNVLGNDGDSDGTINVSSVVVVRAPRGGTAVVNANGTITYTPRLTFSGIDYFYYTVNDIDPRAFPSQTSNQVRVTVRVLR
jgi:FtsP/CotA-like multicopper oxidase with cupredoxin domain